MASTEFRIKDALPKYIWTVHKDSVRVILGRTCYLARSQDGDSELRAYFTPEIPGPYGPGLYWGLHGTVLYLERSEIDETIRESFTYLAIKETKVAETLRFKRSGKWISNSRFEEIYSDYKSKRNAMFK